MKKLPFLFCLIQSAVCALLPLVSCATGQGGLSLRAVRDIQADEYFNAPSDFLIYYDPSSESEKQSAFAALSEVKSYVKDVERALSAERDGDVANFNQAKAGEKISLSQTAYHAFTAAQELYTETDGAFNPAVRLSVDLWGFSPRFFSEDYRPTAVYDREDFKSNPPDEKYVTAFRSLSNFGKIELSEENGDYYAVKPDDTVTVDGISYSMQIDLGSFGKGYAADGARDILVSYGIEYGYVSLGGSSISLLKYPKENTGSGIPYDWRVQITYPEKERAASGEWFAYTGAKDCGISTSGDYERYYEQNGVRYCHIIDTATGAPVQTEICSAFAICPSAASADAYTTALMAMGEEKATSFLRQLSKKNIPAALTLRTATGYRTLTNGDGFQLNSAYAGTFSLERI